MISRQIMRKLLSVEDFPTLPEVMNKILGVAENEDSSAEQLTSVIEQDHAIAVRMLRMANSAFYGHRHPVDTVRTAVVVLGFKSVRLLALATSVFDTLHWRTQPVLEPRDFWMHSLGAAKAAQLLARRGKNAESADSCFTAGLIHDMGKFVLALALKDEYFAVVEAGQIQRRPLREVERDVLGTTSAEVGGWLAEKWQLPSHIVSIVSNLFRPVTSPGVGQEDVVTVSLADRISCVAGFGYAGEAAPIDVELQPGVIPGIDSNSVSEVITDMGGLLEETHRFLGLMKQR